MNDPSRVITLVVVESEAKARERENDPRRPEGLKVARATMTEIVDGPPEFTDLTAIDDWMLLPEVAGSREPAAPGGWRLAVAHHWAVRPRPAVGGGPKRAGFPTWFNRHEMICDDMTDEKADLRLVA